MQLFYQIMMGHKIACRYFCKVTQWCIHVHIYWQYLSGCVATYQHCLIFTQWLRLDQMLPTPHPPDVVNVNKNRVHVRLCVMLRQWTKSITPPTDVENVVKHRICGYGNVLCSHHTQSRPHPHSWFCKCFWAPCMCLSLCVMIPPWSKPTTQPLTCE